MVVAGGDTVTVLQAVDAALDAVTQGVDRPPDAVLDAPVAFGGDLRLAGAVADILADRIAVVAAVGEQDARVAVTLIHQLGIGRAVVRFARRQGQADRQAMGVGAEVDFGREATARAPKTLAMSPPFAPAAQWCARTMVLSIMCKASVSPPLSARACSTTSHKPEVVQRRYCRWTEFQLPSSGGKSRHGMPVRATQNTASNTRR